MAARSSDRKVRTPWLVTPLVFGGTFLLLLSSLWYAWADWVPPSTCDRLRRATTDEVRNELGVPDVIASGKWVYRRPLRMAEFQVYFDADERVTDFGHNR